MLNIQTQFNHNYKLLLTIIRMSDANNLDKSECVLTRHQRRVVVTKDQKIKRSNEAESFCQTVHPGRGPLTQPAGKVSGGDSEQTNKIETWKLCEGRTT